MQKQRKLPPIALITSLVTVAVIAIMLAGCAVPPTVTPVAAWPTSAPTIVAWPTDAPATQIAAPTAAPPTDEPAARAYPLPTVSTPIPLPYPAPDVQGSGGASAAAAEATVALPTEPTRAIVRGSANVDEVQVDIMESMPVQVSITIHGFLPDGCTQLASVEQVPSGEGLVFKVTTEKEADAVCTQALVPFEEVVPVDIGGLAAGTHVINVNGITATLALEPGMLAEPEPTPSTTP